MYVPGPLDDYLLAGGEQGAFLTVLSTATDITDAGFSPTPGNTAWSPVCPGLPPVSVFDLE